jgi:hypothetical protein
MEEKKERAACRNTPHAQDELTDLLFVPHFAQAFLPLVRCHLMALSLFATGHGLSPIG